jgi:hypothetical protein
MRITGKIILYTAVFVLICCSGLFATENCDVTVHTDKVCTLTAGDATDKDCYYNPNTHPNPSLVDDTGFRYEWTAVVKDSSPPVAAGTFINGNQGQTVQWQAPSSPCTVEITVTATNTGNKYIESGTSPAKTVCVIGCVCGNSISDVMGCIRVKHFAKLRMPVPYIIAGHGV